MVCVRTNQHGVAQRLAFMVDGVALGLALIGLRLEQEAHFEHAHAHAVSRVWTVLSSLVSRRRRALVFFVNVACVAVLRDALGCCCRFLERGKRCNVFNT